MLQTERGGEASESTRCLTAHGYQLCRNLAAPAAAAAAAAAATHPIDIHSSVTTIGDEAFSERYALKTAKIPSSVTLGKDVLPSGTKVAIQPAAGSGSVTGTPVQPQPPPMVAEEEEEEYEEDFEAEEIEEEEETTLAVRPRASQRRDEAIEAADAQKAKEGSIGQRHREGSRSTSPRGLDQGAVRGLPSSTQRSDYELADQLQLSAVIAASLADAPPTRKSLAQLRARRSDYDLDAAIAASLSLVIAT